MDHPIWTAIEAVTKGTRTRSEVVEQVEISFGLKRKEAHEVVEFIECRIKTMALEDTFTKQQWATFDSLIAEVPE